MEKLAKTENRFIHASTIIVNLIINKLEEGKNYVMVSKQEVVNYTHKIISYVLEKSNINLIILWMYWDDNPYGDDLNAYEYLELGYSEYFERNLTSEPFIKTKYIDEEKLEHLKSWFRWDLPFYLIEAFCEIRNQKGNVNNEFQRSV